MRLQRLAAGAARSLAEEGESSGDLVAAIRWTRRELEVDASREDTLRRLVHLLDLAGDLPGAVAECDRFAAQLDAIYHDAPTAETRALAEELRDRLDAARPADEATRPPDRDDEATSRDALNANGPTGPDALEDDGTTSLDTLSVGEATGSASPETGAPWTEAGAKQGAGVPVERTPTTAAASVSGGLPHDSREPRGAARRVPPLARAALLLALLLGGWFLLSGRDGADADAAPTVVAVFPFRTTGADPGLDYLGEGMVDLIAARLSGGSLPSSVHATTSIQAWRRLASDTMRGPDQRARELAAELRASAAVVGNVVGTPERLHLSAALISAEDASTLAEARVSGPADSLSQLVDDLTARLVLRHYGMPEHRMTTVSGVPLPAIEAYLRAEDHYRHGRFVDAVREHRAALAVDSTFAPAVLGALTGLLWTGAGDVREAVVPLALEIRERLSQPDRIMLEALLASFRPDPFGERIAAWERVVEVQPLNPEAWFQLGDHLYHWGPALGFPAAEERARVALRRSVELDSAMVPAVTHLAVLLAETGDLDAGRELYQRRVRKAASEGQRHLYDWMFTRMAGEPDPRIDERLAEMEPLYISSLVGTAQLHGIGLSDAEKGIARLYDIVAPSGTEAVVYTHLYHAALNRGRPQEVRRVADRVETWFPRRYDHLRMPVMAALYADGDSTYAAAAAGEIEDVRRAVRRAGTAPDTHVKEALCTLEQWKLQRGDTSTAERTISELASDPADGEEAIIVRQRQRCAQFLSALLDIAEGNPARAIPVLERLSRNPTDGAYGWWEPGHLSNLVLADLYAGLDRPNAALEVIRRRPHHSQWGSQYLASFLVREGKLAERAGDRAAAIEAYRHYLRLRAAPAGRAASAAERVRMRLRELQAGTRSPPEARGRSGR